MVAMVAIEHRSLVFLLRVQVADVSQAGTATAGRMPRSTPCTPWLGLAEGRVCAEAPHATTRCLAAPLIRSPRPRALTGVLSLAAVH